MTNISVDNWLNAWENPELQQEQQKLQKQHVQRQAPPIIAKKPTFEYNHNYQLNRNNNYNFNSSNKPITLPLKPIQIHKNVQRTGKFNDPWAGDFIFFIFFTFFYFNFLYDNWELYLFRNFFFRNYNICLSLGRAHYISFHMLFYYSRKL